MRKMPITMILAACLCVAPCEAESRADTVTDPQLGFTLNLPADFVRRPDLIGATPDIVHAFQYGEAADDGIPVLLLIEKLGGVIGRERLKTENLPPGFDGELFVTKWQGFEVDGTKVRETVNEIDAITYNVQIPLRGEAIQVKLFGPAERDEDLKLLLRQILDGLDGRTNWLSSAAPSTIQESENYGAVLLGLGIGGVIAGLIALWFISRRTPRGTVLVIAIVLYLVSWPLEDIDVREMRLLSGMTRMLGVGGGILGVIDVCRKRRRAPAAEQQQDSRNEP